MIIRQAYSCYRSSVKVEQRLELRDGTGKEEGGGGGGDRALAENTVR